jgi:hypothetical protein
MALHRGIDGSEPLRPDPVTGRAGPQEIRRTTRSGVVARGTLACPRCDAPVAPDGAAVSVTARLACPYCVYTGAVREFLSLAAPTRPAHVVVRVVDRRS